MPSRSKNLNDSQLVVLSSLALTLCYNYAFFHNVTEVYPLTFGNVLFILSLTLLLGSIIALLLLLISWRPLIKPLLSVVFLSASISAYFMDTYNVVVDTNMIQNAAMTNTAEVTDLFSFKLALYFLLLGVVPSVLIYFAKLRQSNFRSTLIAKTKLAAILIVVTVLQPVLFGKSYASFFREHKPLRLYANPPNIIYATGRYISDGISKPDGHVNPLGVDALVPSTDIDRELMILVVGETARADHFSLNGYPQKTNPLLEKEDVISFPRVYSCGTSTAVSVPCMFALTTHDTYKDQDALSTENLLDVLTHAGVNVLWRDNNSDSKGVAIRVPYEDFKSPDRNTICDIECRDEGMLVGLQDYIDSKTEGDILIVLHQMGNHGPAYYKRYPEKFEHFKPTCKTNELANCSEQEIVNAYDNAIRYTDYFLAQVIELLKRNRNKFETGMAYISDHGESLGEKGLYLHGMPYMIAPDAQIHVGAVMWIGEENRTIDINAIKTKAQDRFTHDNIFHTILGFIEVATEVYDKKMDVFAKD